MSVNRFNNPPYELFPNPEEKSVFITAQHPTETVQKTWREKFLDLFSSDFEERCVTDQELKLWSEDQFRARAHLPRMHEGPSYNAKQRHDYSLHVSVAHVLRADNELERLLSAKMMIITRIETQCSALAERLFQRLQGVQLNNITHASMVGAAKACAEVAIDQFQREQRKMYREPPKSTWTDGYERWD